MNKDLYEKAKQKEDAIYKERNTIDRMRVVTDPKNGLADLSFTVKVFDKAGYSHTYGLEQELKITKPTLDAMRALLFSDINNQIADAETKLEAILGGLSDEKI
jgi:hypothetical protein